MLHPARIENQAKQRVSANAGARAALGSAIITVA